jgi:hypothetical protein
MTSFTTYRFACLTALLWFAALSYTFAQEIPSQVVRGQEMPTEEEASEEDTYQPVDFGLQVKNMHLWRGFKVTEAAMTGVDVHYISPNGKFAAGIWGGAGFTGEYTEFDYYVSYAFDNFNLAVWDINNFSSFENANIFNYDPATTSHFIDVTLSYQLPNLPRLNASWSTIVAGRDTYMSNDGELRNAFSNYVTVDYLLVEKMVDLHVFVGGAFSFTNEQHFYGSKPNIVNIGIMAEKNIVFGNYTMPVSATGMWNPEQNYGALQFAVNIF